MDMKDIFGAIASGVLGQTGQAQGGSTGVASQTMTYGSHVYTVSGEINVNDSSTGKRDKPTASVSFTNVPSSYEEFEAVYNGLLGKSIQGCAAMLPMAYELYARDEATGDKCLGLLCNSDVTKVNITRILKTKIVASKYSPANDPYIQRYMPAALLKGASAGNGYRPARPYTVEMCASVNRPYQMAQGTDYYIYIIADGWDTNQRQVEILKSNGSEMYKVFNCPSTYSQCKIYSGQWDGLE